MGNETIVEEYTLPSKGLIYEPAIDPNFKIRSMTVAEEMKRLSSNDSYRAMAEIIEDCLMTKLGRRVYDLCVGDYTYLLHRLRVATYGPEYKMAAWCQNCNDVSTYTLDLDKLKVNEYDQSLDEQMTITLPVSKAEVELRFQTPRDIDWINSQKKEIKKQFPDMDADPTYSLTLETVIKTLNGKPLNKVTAQETLKKMDMRDANYILQKAYALNRKVGVDIAVQLQCKNCGEDINTSFRVTSEFFGPQVD